MNIFDSHAHYDDEAFDGDREELLNEIRDSGIEYIVNAGSNLESSRRTIHLADKYNFIYAAIGIHPQDAGEYDDKSYKILKDMCSNSKIVAVGEIGLDYYWEGYNKDVQKRAFEEQVKLALEMNLPIIVHDREAHQDTMDMVKKYIKSGLRGVMHCYSGSAEMALEYVDMGFYIGFTGVITYKNAVKSVDVLKQVPIDKVLIETDCPYLTPVPFRGKRNDSRHLKYVIEKACEVLNMDSERFASATSSNAKRLFSV